MLDINYIFNVTNKNRFVIYLLTLHIFTLSAMLISSAVSQVILKSIFSFLNFLKKTLFKRVVIFLGVLAIYASMEKTKIYWHFKLFNKIRYFVYGSATLLKQNFTQTKFTKRYRLRECSRLVSVNPPCNIKFSSLEMPLKEFKVKIIDEKMLKVAAAKAREIINIMRGHLNEPTTTDEVIINGWLKTINLKKIYEKGFLYIVDRLKDLIISKGQNIYSCEIEKRIYKFNMVDICTVVAFMQLKENKSLNQTKIREFLKFHLVNFKLLKHMYFLNQFPKNTTKKVLKRALKEQIKEKIY